tara:strand:+ start:130 stop:1218 length:1089 start_codon:yes stop_codon:yes gene_type:complete
VYQETLRTRLLIITLLLLLQTLPTYGEDSITPEKFAELALECVHKEYPNKISHTLQSDEDVKPPRDLYPSFYGCYDWHSSVHGHWLLTRLARLYPENDLSTESIVKLNKSLTAENLIEETNYIKGKGRAAFERPYGIAWLLQLAAELEEWNNESANLWRENIKPLEEILSQRIEDWLPKLTYPVRSGQHSQTAFALGLIIDWARTTGNVDLALLIEERSIDYFANDKDCPISYEPSGADFLSPCLAEADLMRRVLQPQDFSTWLSDFISIPIEENVNWLEPAIVSDPSDPKLAHLDGLNLSRAWMLEGIASGLPSDDPRIRSLLRAAEKHADTGLAAVTGEYYEGGHWLGSFATYLVTQRGL